MRKCNICGRRFRLLAKDRYEVVRKPVGLNCLTEGTTYYNAFDCPHCGCHSAVMKLPPVTPSYNSIKPELKPSEDCISRQYLIERATSWDKHFADSERCVSLTEIQNAPSVTPNARWIPCSEKMPDINIHVLAQFVMGGMAECYYAHNWWHIVGGFRISGDEVIAWQPLPQLYKAESEE